jgi:hypothetical protein
MRNWLILMSTELYSKFVLGVWARKEDEAISKAKKLSQGCKFIRILKVI